MHDLARQFREALLSINEEAAAQIMTETVTGSTPGYFLEEVLVPALESIGMGWEKGSYALSQVYMSGRICENLVDRILPGESFERRKSPRIAIVTLNDYHVLGKRIVASTIRASGYDLIDYGQVDAGELVEKLRDEEHDLVLISVLMLPSALQVQDVVAGLAAGNCKTRVAVGGAPFRLDRQLWKAVGADAVGYTATDALEIVRSFSGGES